MSGGFQRKILPVPKKESCLCVLQLELEGCDEVVDQARPRRKRLFRDNYFTEMCSGSGAGSYSRLVDFCITQL